MAAISKYKRWKCVMLESFRFVPTPAPVSELGVAGYVNTYVHTSIEPYGHDEVHTYSHTAMIRYGTHPTNPIAYRAMIWTPRRVTLNHPNQFPRRLPIPKGMCVDAAPEMLRS